MMDDHLNSDASPVSEFLPTLLRSLGIPVDLRQRENIRTALALPGDWTPSRRASVMAAILSRSPRQQERLEEELTRWLTPAPPATVQAQSNPAKKADPPPEEARAHKPPSFRGAFVTSVKDRPRRLVWTAIALAGLLGLVVVISLAGGVIGAFLFPFLPPFDVAALREYLFWALATAITAIPVGYLIDRIGAALPIYRRAKRERLLRPAALRPGPTYFETARIAAQTAPPWFGRSAMLAVARAVPCMPAGEERRRIDPAATVAATSRAGGVPTLRHRPRKLPVGLLVLGDRDSGARGWSDLPQRLAAILSRTGIDAGLGWFSGLPDVVTLPDGSRTDLASLLRRDERLLLVSDGAMLGDAGRALLQRLGALRRAAWIDERERRFWHRYDPQFGIAGLPAFPGTVAGVQAAIVSLGEWSIGSQTDGERWRPGFAATLAARTAQRLGDASMWAASCAMVQPIGPALAQHLRARFFPHLAPLAFGRLVALEGSRLTQAGLSFGAEVLPLLRQDFALRLSEKERIAILQTIRDLIEADNPNRAATPLQDAYEWHRTRFLLDQDPDAALSELLNLRSTALAPAIQSELKRMRLPHAEAPAGAVLLLRNPSGISQLHQVAMAYGVPLAGEFVDPWRLLKRTRVDELPAAGVVAALAANGALSVLLENGAIWHSGGRMLQTGEQVSAKGVQLAVSHDGAMAAVGLRWSGFVGVYSLDDSSNRPVGGSRADSFDLKSEATEIDAAAAPAPLKTMEMPGLSGLAWFPASRHLAVVSPQTIAIFDFTTAAAGDHEGLRLGVESSLRFHSGLAIAADGHRMFVGNGSDLVEFDTSPASPRSGDGFETERHLNETTVPTQLSKIEAIALGEGEGSWPIAAAGAGLVQVLRRDGKHDGPWTLPPGEVKALELVANGQTVSVLVNDRLVVLHARTGLDLLVDPEGDAHHHAALATATRTALLWGSDRRSITRHGFDDRVSAEAAA